MTLSILLGITPFLSFYFFAVNVYNSVHWETLSDLCPKAHIEEELTECSPREWTVKASVTNWDPAIKPKVTWEVSDGEILSGQGTWSITIRAKPAQDNPTRIRLKITGEGLPEICEIKMNHQLKDCEQK